MALNPLHESHLGRVGVGYVLSGSNLDPGRITQLVGIEPTHSAARGDERVNARGTVIGTEQVGYWRLDSSASVSSKDVNDHIRYLLSCLLPYRESLANYARVGEAYFDVLWESSYLHAGTGPVLDAVCVRGIAQLCAGVGFDIFQIACSDEENPDTTNERV
jgi:hypothetical protein